MSTSPAGSFGMVFPGQGSQHVGMLAELAAQHPVIVSTFAEASSVLGYDLWHLTQTGPAEQLALTHITQPLLVTASVAIWRLWQQRGGGQPVLMAGHSLGEYSALVCAGALDFQNAIGVVKQRGELMQGAVPLGTGSMMAIIGLDDAAIVQCCAEVSQGGAIVTAANYNSPGQVVIAGHTAAVEQAAVLCKQAGAKRALPLSASAPFHSPLMGPAAEKFAQVIAAVEIKPPAIAVIQNASLATSTDPARIRQYLVDQIANQVQWVATMKLFAAQQVHQLLEIGPGKVLTGFNKRIDDSLETIAVNDVATLAQALEKLGFSNI